MERGDFRLRTFVLHDKEVIKSVPKSKRSTGLKGQL